MANVFNPTSGEIRLSVHTPDYAAEGWLVNPPGLMAVLDVPAHYRVIDKGMVRAANIEERQTIDLARLPQIKAEKREELAREFATVILDAESAKIDETCEAATAAFKTAIAAVDAAKTAEEIKVVGFDMTATQK